MTSRVSPDMKLFLSHMATALREIGYPLEFAGRVLPQLRRVLGVLAISIWMPSADGRRLCLMWCDNDPSFENPDLVGIEVPVEGSLAGAVFVSGISEIVHEVSRDPRHCREVDRKSGLSTADMLTVPIHNRGAVVGIMQCVNKCRGRFDDHDRTLGEAAASLMAVVLENSAVLEKLEEANEKLARISKKRKAALRDTLRDKRQLQRMMTPQGGYGQVIYCSESMKHVVDLCRKAASSDVTVLLVGESGTGKDLIASQIHCDSLRQAGPFVGENCAAIPEHLFASEFFGYVRGAFTGAERDRTGLIEKAHKGTLFLDEIGDMPPGIQTALLRVLETGEVRPVGSNTPRFSDFRLITATHRNLEKLVKNGSFRKDLYYRINVFRIALPPLRNRPEDIERLARHFMALACARYGKKLRGIEEDVLECFHGHPFPGNIRQLKNEVEQAVVLAEDGGFLKLEHLSCEMRRQVLCCPEEGSSRGLREKVEQLEKKLILEALQTTGGNKTQAAKRLGLSRFGLSKKIMRYGLETPGVTATSLSP